MSGNTQSSHPKEAQDQCAYFAETTIPNFPILSKLSTYISHFSQNKKVEYSLDDPEMDEYV